MVSLAAHFLPTRVILLHSGRAKAIAEERTNKRERETRVEEKTRGASPYSLHGMHDVHELTHHACRVGEQDWDFLEQKRKPAAKINRQPADSS